MSDVCLLGLVDFHQHKNNQTWGVAMEAFGILGFVFGLLAFLRTEKLIKNLKQQGVLDENYKAD